MDQKDSISCFQWLPSVNEGCKLQNKFEHACFRWLPFVVLSSTVGRVSIRFSLLIPYPLEEFVDLSSVGTVFAIVTCRKSLPMLLPIGRVCQFVVSRKSLWIRCPLQEFVNLFLVGRVHQCCYPSEESLESFSCCQKSPPMFLSVGRVCQFVSCCTRAR